MHETRLEVGMERSLTIAKGVAVAVVIGGGALLVLRGSLTVGVLTVFASYISNLLKPVEKINDLASAVSKGLAAGERLLALLEHAPEVRDAPAAVQIGRARGALELEDVHFAYPDSDGRGEDGVDLSGGQRRRVALARAFLLDRPILVLDEPLEGVDTANEALIVEALKRIRDRRTCLVITHRPSLLDCADAVYRLESGRIVDGMSIVRGRGSAAGAGQ